MPIKPRTTRKTNKITKLLYWKEYGEKDGYALLSKKYNNCKESLQWQDKNGIIFEQSPVCIKKYGWVKDYNKSYSARKNKIEHYNELKKIIENNGGTLLSTEYKRSHDKLEVKDIYGNIFYISGNELKNGFYPTREKIICENIIRQCMEFLLNAPFPSTWKIITQKNKKNLQLDGYNENVIINNKSYKIAFEYQGYYTHRTDDNTIKRDEYKKEFCKNNNIYLIVVDVIEHKNKTNPVYICNLMKKLIMNTLKFNVDFDDGFIIDFNKIKHNKIYYEKWKKFGEDNGIELISTEYINSSTPLKWKKDNFIFERSPDIINTRGINISKINGDY
jgi:hypothetical protein